MSIYIPEKIKVGYQNRNDTYTKKLAYVIYYDEKGKPVSYTHLDVYKRQQCRSGNSKYFISDHHGCRGSRSSTDSCN